MTPFPFLLILLLLAGGCVDVEAIRLQADQGDPAAQFRLGEMYERGENVPRNYREAFKWYQRAAEQGFPRAQNSLGWFYREGRGAKRDLESARRWFRRAAEQGLPMAQLNLGWMYDQGLGVEKDKAKAEKWFRMAADAGLGEAQLNLGLMYWKGDGVEKDPVEAYKWLTLAGDSRGNNIPLHSAILALDELEGSMSQAQLERGKALAGAFLPKPHGIPDPAGMNERSEDAE